jgi:hypothetical protein
MQSYFEVGPGDFLLAPNPGLGTMFNFLRVHQEKKEEPFLKI